jgi:hypothetical protein
VSFEELLSNLGISITANAIFEFVRSIVNSSQTPTFTLVQTRLGTFLKAKGIANSDVVAEKMVAYLQSRYDIEALKAGATVLDGEHIARGIGKVTAIHTRRLTLFKPGTKSIAEGLGEVTATKIGGED